MSDDDRGGGRGHEPPAAGAFWMAGWLFTLGFAGLPLGKALLAILLWPWYLGTALG